MSGLNKVSQFHTTEITAHNVTFVGRGAHGTSEGSSSSSDPPASSSGQSSSGGTHNRFNP